MARDEVWCYAKRDLFIAALGGVAARLLLVPADYAGLVGK